MDNISDKVKDVKIEANGKTVGAPPTLTFKENGIPEPLSLAQAVCAVLDDRLGEDISLLQVGDVTGIADYFVLCTGKSTTHVRALADEVEFKLRGAGAVPDRSEGRGDGNSWMVIDYGNVMVHIFTRADREYYNLERLFSDSKRPSDTHNWPEQAE